MAGEEIAIGGGIVLFFILIWMILIGLSIAAFVFWILMIIDVANRNFPKEDDKIIWILVVVIAGIIGALIYYFAVKRKYDGKNRK